MYTFCDTPTLLSCFYTAGKFLFVSCFLPRVLITAHSEEVLNIACKLNEANSADLVELKEFCCGSNSCKYKRIFPQNAGVKPHLRWSNCIICVRQRILRRTSLFES